MMVLRNLYCVNVTSVSEEHVAILRVSEASEPRFRGVKGVDEKKEVRTKGRK